MKKSIVTSTLVLAGMVCSSLMMVNCGSKTEQAAETDHVMSDSTAHHDEADSTQMAFACPMHPEITGKEGDTCSKCGMKLEAIKTDSTKVN